jgi:hypothetical protein
MLLKKLADLTIADLDALVANSMQESRFLDFKVARIGDGDRDKREFLADVSAFANASGGDMLLGIREQDGAAAEVVGVEVDNPDAEIRRLGDIIRYGLEPRLSTVDVRWLPIDGRRGVMAIRVGRSWAAPHRVTFLKDMNFYVRNAAGKNQMTVDDLRQAFGLSESVAQRIRAFRDERIQAIQCDELPFTVRSGVKVVVHVVPLSSAADPLELHFRGDVAGMVRPIGGGSGFNWQYCLDGFATTAGSEPLRAYSLMFRTGAVECLLNVEREDPQGKFLGLYTFEAAVRDAWRQFRAFAARNEVEPPVFVFASLLEVAGIGPRADFMDSEQPVPSRKPLLKFPEVSVGVDDFDKPPEALFKRLFDVASNAFGLARSKSYDADGKYVGPK